MRRLMHMEQTHGVTIKHGRNGRDYRLSELPNYSVDVYYPQNNRIYESFGCFGMGKRVNRSKMSAP